MHSINWVYGAGALATLVLLGLCSLVAAQEGPLPVKISVDSILASYTPQNSSAHHAARIQMDPRLSAKGLATRLKVMFPYSDYHLVKSQREASSYGGAVAFNLPGGHILQVAPLGQQGNGIAMELALFEGARLLMRLPFRMTNGGMLMLVDQHYPNRFYITAISADCPAFSRARRSIPTPLAPDVAAPPMPAWIPAQ